MRVINTLVGIGLILFILLSCISMVNVAYSGTDASVLSIITGVTNSLMFFYLALFVFSFLMDSVSALLDYIFLRQNTFIWFGAIREWIGDVQYSYFYIKNMLERNK